VTVARRAKGTPAAGSPPFRCGVVAVVGRPNVGKSTLVNQLVGEKVSIVSPMPQTTRNRVSGVFNPPGAQVILLDTPGIHKPLHRMNRRMVETAFESLEHPDLVFVVVEAKGIGPGDRYVISRLPRTGPPVFLVVNKVDLVSKPTLLPLLDAASKLFPFAEMVPVSSRDGTNLDLLTQLAVPRLPEGPALFPADQLTDLPERFLVSELIREKICLRMREEIPHSAAVLIESWDESREGLIRIEAAVLVDKENHRAMLIGKEGSQMKRIGTEARQDIEKLLASRVFLKLWVKVQPGWREAPAILRSLELA